MKRPTSIRLDLTTKAQITLERRIADENSRGAASPAVPQGVLYPYE
ncbi:MAG: hypothetical protein M3R51_07975 [Candidatus Eremiobacteraeota bacterium]|nr:hypothetical protein [Candidatus Eremiobacteraeota bacterium]